MSSLKDVSGIPTEGKDLIIVTAVNNVLHFRIFDGDDKLVVDSDERSDKDRIISAVKSIIDHKHCYLWIPAPWIRRSVDGLEKTVRGETPNACAISGARKPLARSSCARSGFAGSDRGMM